jgi:hypothetical protein
MKTAARRLLQRGSRTKEDAAPNREQRHRGAGAERQHGARAPERAAGIHGLQQGGIHQAAGQEPQGEPEGEFAVGREQAPADESAEARRHAALLNGHQAVGRQEADHEDAGDDHGMPAKTRAPDARPARRPSMPMPPPTAPASAPRKA